MTMLCTDCQIYPMHALTLYTRSTGRVQSHLRSHVLHYIALLTEIGVQGWLSGSLVMMQNKSYGMFWVQTQPCTPEQLEKKSAATDHTVCVWI